MIEGLGVKALLIGFPIMESFSERTVILGLDVGGEGRRTKTENQKCDQPRPRKSAWLEKGKPTDLTAGGQNSR